MKHSTLTQEWFKQAEYDLGTANAMFRSRRYIYTVFMCHLCLEKTLKGLIAADGRVPVKSHDLIFLLDRSGMLLPKQHVEFLEMLNDVSVPTRYPDDLEHLITQYPRKRTKDIVDQCREVFEWIKNYLQK